jgi:hypothetical protein
MRVCSPATTPRSPHHNTISFGSQSTPEIAVQTLIHIDVVHLDYHIMRVCSPCYHASLPTAHYDQLSAFRARSLQ